MRSFLGKGRHLCKIPAARRHTAQREWRDTAGASLWPWVPSPHPGSQPSHASPSSSQPRASYTVAPRSAKYHHSSAALQQRVTRCQSSRHQDTCRTGPWASAKVCSLGIEGSPFPPCCFLLHSARSWWGSWRWYSYAVTRRHSRGRNRKSRKYLRSLGTSCIREQPCPAILRTSCP